MLQAVKLKTIAGLLLSMNLALIGCAQNTDSPVKTNSEKNSKEEFLNREGTRPTSEEKSDREADSSAFIPYEIPKAIQTKIDEESDIQPQGPRVPPPKVRPFEIFESHLKVDLNNETMEFTGSLCVRSTDNNCTNLSSSKIERIQLGCKFDRTVLPLECSDMFPKDQKVAAQKRMQAAALCMKMEVDANGKSKCTELVFDFFVLINGKKESQRFESEPVYVRKASSGDSEDINLDDLTPADEIPKIEPPVKLPIEPLAPEPETQIESKPTHKQPAPKDESSVTPIESPPAVQLDAEEEIPQSPPHLDAVQVEEELSESNSDEALEYDGPTVAPAPKADHQYSIPDIAKIKPALGLHGKKQAYRKHTDGKLFNANQLKRSQEAAYFLRTTDDRNNSPQRAYGTDLMIDLIEKSLKLLNSKYPGRPEVVIASISQKAGGPLCRRTSDGRLKCHRSHQNGLDADIAYPSKNKTKKDLWNALNGELDIERFVFLAKTLVRAEGSPVIAMFVDRQIKKMACQYAKKQFPGELRDSKSDLFKALRHMTHWDGHKDHFHLRLNCPSGSTGCKPVLVEPKFKGSGCN